MSTAARPDASRRWHFPSWRMLALASAAGVLLAGAETAIAFLCVSSPEGPRPLGIESLLLLYVLSVPLEEWLFRGVVLQRLLKPVGAVGALVVSSALFAFAHRWGFPSWAFRFVGGLVLGAFYLWTRSLWPSILLHYAHNVTWITAMYLLTPP